MPGSVRAGQRGGGTGAVPGGAGDESRTPDVVKDEVTGNGFLYSPFVNKDKKTIFQIYQDLNLLETLFPLTRSCETTRLKNFRGHCGECWWCKERMWGFGRV